MEAQQPGQEDQGQTFRKGRGRPRKHPVEETGQSSPQSAPNSEVRTGVSGGSAPFRPREESVEEPGRSVETGPLDTTGTLSGLGLPPEQLVQPRGSVGEVQEITVSEEVQALTLEECAQRVLGALPELRHRERIDALIQDRQYSHIQFVMAVLLMYSETAASQDSQIEQFLEEAAQLLQSSGAGLLAGSGGPRISTCEQCHQSFVGHRSRQKYCCNACGSRATGGAPLVEHTDTCEIIPQAA